jgi:capsular polysaccharide transport system permease protein
MFFCWNTRQFLLGMKGLSLPISIVGSFRLQFRVITALILRELQTRFGRDNLGYLWMVGEPTMFCVGVAVMWTAIRPAHDHGVPVTAFVITGYVPLTMWRHCLSRAVKAFDANGSLLFHRQVTPLDIIMARVILEVYGSLITFVIVGGGAVLMGFIEPPKEIGLLYIGLVYNILFCTATALLAAALSERSDIIERTVQVFSYLSIPFSGAFTMVDWVPKNFQNILLYSPSIHAFEMIRKGWFGSSVVAHYDFVFATWINGVLLLIGISLTLRSRRHIVVQ